MNNLPKINKNFTARLLRWLGFTCLSILLACITFFSLPKVQNILFTNLLHQLSEHTQCKIQHHQFFFKWFRNILLTNLSIHDPNHQSIGSIKSLKIKISLWDLLWKHELNIRYVEINQGNFNLIKPIGATSFNAEVLLSQIIDYFNPSPQSSSGLEALHIHQVILKNLSLQVEDLTAPTKQGVDLKHCKIESINTTIKKLTCRATALSGKLEHFTADMPASNLALQKCHTHFHVTPSHATFQETRLSTTGSTFEGNLHLTYQGIELSEILPSLYIRSDIKELSLSTQELAYFIPYFKHHPNHYILKGELIGNLEELHLQNFHLGFGALHSHISGNASLKEVAYMDKTSFNVHLVSGEVHTSDLLPYIKKKYHDRIRDIKIHQIQHTLSGSLSQFTSQGNWETNIGKLTTALVVGIDKKAHKLSLKGDITTQSLELGKLLSIPKLEEVTMNAYIDGYGTSLDQIDCYLRTHITQLGFQGYRYQNIRTDGNIGNFSFRGNLAIDDPHMVANFSTQADWSLSTKSIDLNGLITKLALDKLQFTQHLTQCSGELHLTLQHASWDDFTTDITLKHIQLAGKTSQPLYVEELRFVNEKKEGLSALSLHSDLLTIQAEGAVKYSCLIHDVKEFIRVYQQRLLHHPIHTPTYTEGPYKFTYYIHLKDINPLLQVITPTLYIAPNTSLQGSFSQQEEVQFELHMPHIVSLALGKYRLEGTTLHMTALQNRGGSLMAATHILRSNKQAWGDALHTTNYLSDISWINDQITFKNSIEKEDSQLKINLAGLAHLSTQGIEVKFNNTTMQVDGKLWELHPAGTIMLDPTAIRFHNILLSHGAQQISVEGQYADNTSKKLIIHLNKVDLSSFTSLLTQEVKIGGSAHGTVLIQKQHHRPYITSKLHINQLIIDKLTAGNLHTKFAWNPTNQQLTINCTLQQDTKPTIHIDGTYYTSQSPKRGLDLVAEFSRAPLALIKPLVHHIFGEFNGRADGKMHIRGQLQTPSLLGVVKVSDLELKFNTLNARYEGQGSLICSTNNITIDKLHLTDDQNGRANVTGKVTHHYFKDFCFDLQGNVNTLKILHAKYEDNHHFYGKGIVSGQVALTGMIDNLLLTAHATTHKGSNLIIPIHKRNDQLGQESYIRFMDLKSCKKQGNKNDYLIHKPNPLNLNMTLDITPEASAEILLNGKEGDIIQGKGRGTLTLKLDSESNLAISGNYEMVEGTYNFSAYEVVKRKFNILEGSTITWIDKPYDGILHVKATHHQRASLFPLLETPQNNPDKKKYPIDILLSLEGTLAEPDLRFDIDFPKNPDNTDLQEAIYAFKDKITADTNYLEKQVLSLIILRTFFPSNLSNLREDALKSSVGEIFSQQLNNLASQWDDNLGIDTDIDLEELTQEEITSLPTVRLSYNFLSGKLMVARASRIDFYKNIANLIGDWSVEYGLTSDNKLRAKLHISPSGTDTSIGVSNISKPVFGGFSLVYVKNFNRWRDLLSWKSKKQPNKSASD